MIASASFLFGVGIGWSLHRHRVTVREAKSDELRFLLAPVVQHSVEDAARRVGC